MFSVIIPSLKEYNNVPKLLKTIIKQKIKPDEIFIVEADSVKKMEEAIKKIDLPIKVLKSKPGHPSFGRNIGGRASKSENLFFMDADVRLPNNFFKKCLNEIKIKKIEAAAIQNKPNSKKFRYWPVYVILNFYLRISPYFVPAAVGTCMFSTKKVFNKIKGFDESIILCEDAAYVRAAKKNKFKFKTIKSTFIYADVRRFEEHGYWNTVFKILGNTFLNIFGKEDHTNRFHYEFGKYKRKT